MDAINIGIIGCGWAGTKHLDALIDMGDVTVCALASSNEDRLKDALAKVPGARSYKTAEDMIHSEESLDAVVLCVTPDRHDGLEQLCASKGIHMYIEKPIELDLSRAEEIASAIEASGVIASVGYQERYNSALSWAFAFLTGRQIRMIEARWMGHVVGANWWRNKAASGGQVIEQSTHLFDMIRYLAGDGRVVGAISAPAPAPGPMENDVEPASVVLIKMDNGALAKVTTACFLDPKMQGRVGITIWCSDGRLEYNWDRGEIRTIEHEHEESLAEPGGHHPHALQAFIKAIRTGDRSLVLSDYRDALRTFRMTLDAQALIEQSIAN